MLKNKGPKIYEIYVEGSNVEILKEQLLSLNRYKVIINSSYNNSPILMAMEKLYYYRAKVTQEELTFISLKVDIKKILGPLDK